jgi:hypothetical protein
VAAAAGAWPARRLGAGSPHRLAFLGAALCGIPSRFSLSAPYEKSMHRTVMDVTSQAMSASGNAGTCKAYWHHPAVQHPAIGN